jgi:hypothetical protein
MLDASINKTHPTMFVNIGLQNGVLLRTVLDPVNGQTPPLTSLLRQVQTLAYIFISPWLKHLRFTPIRERSLITVLEHVIVMYDMPCAANLLAGCPVHYFEGCVQSSNGASSTIMCSCPIHTISFMTKKK